MNIELHEEEHWRFEAFVPVRKSVLDIHVVRHVSERNMMFQLLPLRSSYSHSRRLLRPL